MLKPTGKTKDITLEVIASINRLLQKSFSRKCSIVLINLGMVMNLISCSTMTTTSLTSPAIEPVTKPISWKDREFALNAIKSWHINGKIAVQTPQQSGSATVNWTQQANRFNISIVGPLGAGGIKLYGTRTGQVTLQTSDGQVFTDNNPEQLLAKRWGYHLPVSNLSYWIRGLPSPNMAASTHFDTAGRLSTLIQQGWVIQYLSYVHRGKVDLPDRITIHSPSLQVKIAIYEWQTESVH